MNKFWNFKDDGEGRELFLDGPISNDTWWGDEVTPKEFKGELESGKGDITVWINSPGGDVFAGSQIYTMLKEYNGKVTVKIDGIAASAASVIAMSGDEVLMSPTALMMIHNPSTIAIGDTSEMQKAIDVLAEVKESIINAYINKTGRDRDELSDLMDAETYMNANKAVELGFADSVLYTDEEDKKKKVCNFIFSRRAITNSLLDKLHHEYSDDKDGAADDAEETVKGGEHQPLSDNLDTQKKEFNRIKKKLIGEKE